MDHYPKIKNQAVVTLEIGTAKKASQYVGCLTNFKMLRTTTLAYNIKTLGWHGPMDNPRSHPLPGITSHVEHKKYQQTLDISMKSEVRWIHSDSHLETPGNVCIFLAPLHPACTMSLAPDLDRVVTECFDSNVAMWYSLFKAWSRDSNYPQTWCQTCQSQHLNWEYFILDVPMTIRVYSLFRWKAGIANTRCVRNSLNSEDSVEEPEIACDFFWSTLKASKQDCQNTQTYTFPS